MGIKIYIDDKPQGTTTKATGGLVVQDVVPGQRVLKAEKSGYVSHRVKLKIGPDEVKTYKLPSFKTKLPASQPAPVGSLVIQSLPIKCDIAIPKANISYAKGPGEMDRPEYFCWYLWLYGHLRWCAARWQGDDPAWAANRSDAQFFEEDGQATIPPGQCIRKFIDHTGNVRSVKLSPDGKLALSGSVDKTLKLWNVASGKCFQTLVGSGITAVSIGLSNGELRLRSTLIGRAAG